MGKYKDIISKRYGSKAASAALNAFEDEEKEREQRGVQLRSQNLMEQQNAYNAYQRALNAAAVSPSAPQFQNTATAAGNAAAERANAARIALNAVNPAQSAGARTAYDVLKRRYQGDVLSSHYTQKDAEAAQAQNLYRKYMAQAQTEKASSGVDQDAAIQLARRTGQAAAGAQTRNPERDLGSVNFGGNIAYRNMLRYYGPKDMSVESWNNDGRAKWTDEQKKAMKELDAAEKAAAAYDNPQYAQTQSTAGNKLFAQKHLEDTRKAAQKLGITSNDLETYRHSSGGERNLQESLSYADDAVRKLGSGSQKDLLAIMERKWDIDDDPTNDREGINREIREFEDSLRKENGWTDKQLRNYEQYASLLYENNKNDQNTYKTYVRQNDKKHDVADTIADNALSVAQNVLGAPSATIAHLGAVAGRSDRQQAASPYTQGAYAQNAAANTRSVTESGIKSKAGRFAYNVGMSAADSAAFALAAGGPALPAALSSAGFSTAAVRELTNAINLSSFSMSAGNQTYRQALEQGDDTRTALTKGVMDAAIEAATERIGGENMIRIATGKVKPGMAKAMLSQFGAEGIEETMGDIMNLVGQQALLGKKSDIEETIASYEKQGMSRAKARDKALKEWAVQLAEDTAAGGLSGLGMGAAANAASGAYGTAQTVRDLRNAGPEVYKNIGNSITSDSEAYHTEGAQRAAGKAKGIAENLAARMENGGKAGLLDRARLAGNIEMMNANESAYYEENPEQYKKDAEERQKHLQESVRVDFENRETPEQYRVKETDYSGSQGYQDMLKVSNSTGTMADKAASLGEIYNQMKNSKSPAARQYADAYYEMFSAKSGITGQAASLAKQTAQDAYLAGRNGEQFTAGTLKQKEAYNAGQIAYMKDISSRRAEDAEKVKNADVSVGSVKSRAKEFVEGRNGETMVKLENGSAVPFDAVDFGNDIDTYVWSHAARQGTVREKNAYIQNFKENVPLGVQDNAFRKYYTAGALDQSMERSENTSFDNLYEKDNSVYKALIDRDTLRNMYNAGAQETEAQYVKAMEQAGNTVARRGTGKVYVYEKNGPVTDITDEKSYTDRSGEEMYYLPLVKAFAKATNTDIVLSQNEGEKINGYYDRAMQRIVLNTNNREDLYHTLIHEGMGEVLEAFNTKGALKVRSALLRYTAEKYQGDELIRSVEKYQDAYTAVEKTKTVSAAMGEMMNDAMSGIFSSKEGIHDLSEWLDRKQGVKEQKSVLGTLADHFRGIETAMRNLLNRGTLTSSGRHAAMIAEKNASKIRKMILDEMDVAIENAQNATLVGGEKEKIAFSVNISDAEKKQILKEENKLQQQIDNWNGIDESIHFEVAKTPDILKNKLNFESLPIEIDSSKVKKIFKKHPEMKNLIFRVPEILHDPVIIMDSMTVKGSYVLFGNLLDENSNPVLVSIIPRPTNRRGIKLNVQKITSTYAKENAQHILNQSNIEYVNPDKKITTSWQKLTRLQLPFVNLNAGGYSNTVSHSANISNNIQNTIASQRKAENDISNKINDLPEERHFSLDVDKPVQQTKDLIAVHNLSVERLIEDIAKLGGFPSPSIAIIREGMEHSGYGDTSVIFYKDTIDPQLSDRNRVYGGDAWTPVYPKLEYKLNEEKLSEIEAKISRLVSNSDRAALGNIALDASNASDQFNGADGDPVKAYGNNDLLKRAWMSEKGIVPNVKKTESQLAFGFTNEQVKLAAEILGKEGAKAASSDPSEYYDAHTETIEKIRKALNDQNRAKYEKLKDSPLKFKRALYERDLYKDLPFAKFDNLVRGADNYLENGVRLTDDPDALADAVNDAVNQHKGDYEKWVRDLFKGTVEKSGIRNNKEYYTKAGNPRSWEQLHAEETLDNIVDIMNGQEAKGAAGMFAQSGLQAVATKNFRSVDEIHQNEYMLQNLPEEEYKKIKDAYAERFSEIVHRMEGNTDFASFQNVSNNILDAVKKRKTPEGIENYLRQFGGMNVYEGAGNDILILVNDISDMPTGYFEAKPGRAVYSNEIAAAVVPESITDEQKQILDENGVRYITYKTGDESARQQAISSLEDVKFSLNDVDMPTDDQMLKPFDEMTDDEYRQAVNVISSVLGNRGQSVEGVHISKDATYKIAQDIIKQTGSSYGINALAENLGKIYSFVEVSGKKVNYTDLMRLVRQVAVPVIDQATMTEASESAKKIMASFGATPVRLTSKQLNEVKYIFGSLQAFKKAVPGIKISQNANVDLDQMWSSLVDESEGLLNLDTNEGDQPVALADMVASLQPRTVNAYEAYGYDKEEAANDVAMDIIRGYYQYASTKAAGKGAEEAAKDIRGKVAEEQKKYRERVRNRYEKRYQDARAKAEEETDALRERMRDQYDSARENDRIEIANIKVKNNARWQKAAEQRRVEHERRMIDRHWGALFNMIDNPTDTRHVPKALQNVVLNLLDSVDMVNPHVHETENGKYRVRILDKIREDGTYEYVTKEFDSMSDAMEAYREAAEKGSDTKTNKNWQEKMQKVATLYQEAKANTESSTGLDDFVANLDTDLSADLQKIVSDHGKVSVSQLDSYQLRILDRVMANVASSINKYNTFITDNREQISGTAESIMSHASDVNGRKEHRKYVNAALDFVSLDNATPDTYFSGMGQGGQQVYKMLMNAMDTKTHDVRQAQEYMMGDGSRENGVYKQGALAGTSREEMEKWTGNNAEIMTFDADTGSRIEGRAFGNGTITLTPAQLMSLYELTKRSQAMLHTKGGIKIDTITVKGIERTQKPQFLSIEALSNVVSNLTPQQKALADAMQKFMGRQAATWGNAASNRMFGYDKFTEENYFPITVDKNTVATSNSDMSDRLINAIRNMGITKKTMPDAANPLVVKDIFDVFSGHINDMATYHAYAPAIQDLIRVYNYKTVGDVKGGFLDFKTVKDAIEALYGRGGNTYMKNLVGSLNQNERSNYTITRLGKLGSNYKAAAIGGNLRVVLQQPMAWFRAGMVIDYKYLMQGLAGNEMADTMRENTSDMCWAKSQGNVDGVITKGFKQQITGASTKRERLINASMYLAGKADDITWSALYRAVYAEQEAEFQKAGKETQKGGSYTKEFADAVNSRFDDMVSRTQVIDSTLFRSNLMRSGDSKVQFFTSFMAEPTKTYNMFLREVIYAQQTKRNGRYTREAVRRIGKAAVVFTLTQLATAFAQSLADAFRRDDDDTKWIDAFLAAYRDNFIDDMNLFNLLPGVKDIWSMVDNARGIQSSGFYEQQALSNLIDTAAQDVKYMGQLRSGESTTKTAYGILMLNLRSIANFLAVPVYNVARTGAEIYNEMNDLWGGENLYKTNSDRQKHYRGAIMKAIESGDEEDVEKALDGYLKSGGKIGSTLKTEEKKELKEKYAEAYAEGNESEMERIRRTTAPIFEESRKQKQQEAEESGEEVPEDFDPDEYYGKWLRESDQSRAAKESVFHAVDTGGDYKKSIEEAVKWGYSYKSISSALTRQYKQQYADALKKNRSEATVLKNRLAETYAYLSDRDGTYDGKSHKEKVEIYTKTIEKWGE